MIKLKQLTPQKFCLKCDICCRFACKDTVWSARLLREEKESLQLKDKNFKPIPNPKGKNFICPNFNIKENKCLIYKDRPFDCRLYPFLLNRTGAKVFLAVDTNCPFIKSILKNEKFKAYAAYLKDFFNVPCALSLLSDNPQIINSYNGVLNLFELRPCAHES